MTQICTKLIVWNVGLLIISRFTISCKSKLDKRWTEFYQRGPRRSRSIDQQFDSRTQATKLNKPTQIKQSKPKSFSETQIKVNFIQVSLLLMVLLITKTRSHQKISKEQEKKGENPCQIPKA